MQTVSRPAPALSGTHAQGMGLAPRLQIWTVRACGVRSQRDQGRFDVVTRHRWPARACTAAILGSINRTSPRCGDFIRLLVTIELDKQAVGTRHEVVVGQMVGTQGQAVYEFSHDLRPITVRKRVDFVEQLLGGLGHEVRFAFTVLGVKLVG